MGWIFSEHCAERTFSQSTNGPTRHPPQAHSLQHHLQPPSCGKDPWWQACVPPPQKARDFSQVR